MTSMMKTIKLGKKKLKKMPDDGKNSLVYELMEYHENEYTTKSYL
jgi:hypothetical protein